MKKVVIGTGFWLIVVLCFVAVLVHAEEKSVNLLPYTFQDENKDGFPDGFNKDKSLEGKLSYDPLESGEEKNPALRIDLPAIGTAQLDLTTPVKLEKNKKYLFAVEVKIKDISHEGAWYGTDGVLAAVMMYVYGQNGQYKWMAISGKDKKSTKEWVRVMRPFNTGEIPEMSNVQIYLRCLDISGTIWFRNPALVEIPAEIQMDPHFILSDGTIVSNGFYLLP